MTLADHLEAFDRHAREGGFDYARAITHDGGEGGPHVVVTGMIHGDETGSLPAIVQILDELADGTRTFGGRVTFAIGNPEAGLQGVRFLESDLNRVFVDEPPDTHEGRRARELKPILDAADIYVDLHQTILETKQPFYICPFHLSGWHWSRALAGAEVWVTRHPGQAFSSGTMCADEYVRLKGRPAITLELSQKGFGNGGEGRAHAVLARLLTTLDAIRRGETTLEAAAEAKPELVFLETVHREPFATDGHALADGWVNFTPVAEGAVLHAEGTPEMVAPTGGYVLFPKYPPRVDGTYKKPLPKEIFRIVQPLAEHPTVAYADAL
jgi:succinylglutamate desuccinylase